MEIKGFKNVNLVLKDGVVKSSLSISDGKIASIGECEEGVSLNEELFVAPGFVDEHIHGCNGADWMDSDHACYDKITGALPQEGVTSVLATTMTMDKEIVKGALRAIRSYMEKEHQGTKVQGVHLEGPFISPKHVGAQDPKMVLKPSREILDEFMKESGGSIREVTFAYEEGGEEMLEYMLEKGICPSIGHSDCKAEKMKEGIRRGIRCVTHTYNAQTGLHHRDPGIVGEAFINDGVKTELISDFIHICPDAIKVLFRCKKKEDIVLISDSTEGKYLAPGEYELGGQKVYIYDGVARLESGTIAGSILKLDQALRNIAPIAEGYSMSDLINLVTINPAKNVGIDAKVGSIEVGKDADLVIIDKDFNVYMTIVDGKIAYVKEGFSL